MFRYIAYNRITIYCGAYKRNHYIAIITARKRGKLYNMELEPTEALQIVIWADKRKKALEESGDTQSVEYKLACSIGNKYNEAIKAAQK